jgi:hypothetical protein
VGAPRHVSNAPPNVGFIHADVVCWTHSDGGHVELPHEVPVSTLFSCLGYKHVTTMEAMPAPVEHSRRDGTLPSRNSSNPFLLFAGIFGFDSRPKVLSQRSVGRESWSRTNSIVLWEVAMMEM